ncbi:MAG TPA: hypothetical protein PLX97_09600, partial [Gemmatales bacterium]|nr:hypothetical protein [Gemmatales bacterium]
MRRIGWFALGAWLLAWPLYAQGQKCQGNSSSSSASSTSSSASSLASGGRTTRVLNNTSTTSTSTETQIAQLNSQISQLQQLRSQLISGEVTPPANSGVSTAQAVQVVSRRITYL